MDSLREQRSLASKSGVRRRRALRTSAYALACALPLLSNPAAAQTPSALEAWRVDIDGGASGIDRPWGLTVTTAGDVFAIGGLTTTSGFKAGLVRLGWLGLERWRTTLGDGGANSLLTLRNGDVIVAGTFKNNTLRYQFTVIRVSYSNGAESWRFGTDGTGTSALAGQSAAGSAVELPNGDLVVVGTLVNQATGSDLAVLRLDATTGQETWRTTISGDDLIPGDRGGAVVAAPGGDFIITGAVQGLSGSRETLVVRYDGATGAQEWRKSFAGTYPLVEANLRAISIGPSGDVLLGGELANPASFFDFTVIKLAGATGTELWRREIDGGSSGNDFACCVLEDARGRVFAAGALRDPNHGTELTAMELDGATGATVWQKLLHGNGTAPLGFLPGDAATAMVLDTAGDLVLTGEMTNLVTQDDFAIVKMSSVDGSVRWLTYVDSGFEPSINEPVGVALGPAGHVAALGTFDSARDEDWRVFRFQRGIANDADLDGIADAVDNCPLTFNPGQQDVGGVGPGSPQDGIGNACQCGDVLGDGRVTGSDGTAITRASLRLAPYTTGTLGLPFPGLCDVGGTIGCTGADGTLIKRASLGLPPGLAQVCPLAN